MKLDEKQIKEMIKLSFEAQKNSYSPYSHFKVGISLLCKDGKIFKGTNIENASHSAGICGERVTFTKAISEGERDFVAICITCSNPETYAYPCGVCRQFMSEFDLNLQVIVAKSENDYKIHTLEELLPHSFNKDDL